MFRSRSALHMSTIHTEIITHIHYFRLFDKQKEIIFPKSPNAHKKDKIIWGGIYLRCHLYISFKVLSYTTTPHV